MTDRTTTVLIGFDAEAGTIDAVLAAIKGKFRTAVAEIETATKNIELFGNVEKGVQGAAAALEKAKANVVQLTAALEKAKAAGAGSTTELEKGLRVAQVELKATEREFNKQVDTLTKLENTLTRAGIDTRNLATEQARLAEASRAANAALVEQSSKALLGFKGLKDVQPQINQLNAAFLSLRDSGKLTFGELSVAQARLQQQVAALRAETSGLGQAFADIRGRMLAFAAAFVAISAGVLESARNFRDFAQQVAAVDSIAETSQANIAKLATGVRDLAKALGVDAVESTKALYEIISSGIPQENALTVLEQASKAAIAGLTDVKTAAAVGVAVLNGYGLQITELGHVYDVLFQTVKDGVVTFPELAKNLGTIIPAARAAKVPLEDLGAAFVVLTRQGFEAPEAATSINRAIIDLSAPAPEAAKRLSDLGIAVDGLTNTIEQLASRKFNLSQIGQIVPDVRAQRAVLALVNNFQLLRDELGQMNEQAGQAQAAYLKLANTPQQQVARFNAAVKDLSISLGEFVTGTGGLVTALTDIVNAFNSLAPATKTTVLQFSAIAVGGAAVVLVARQLVIPLNLLAGALASVGAGGQAAAEGLSAAALAMGALKVGAAAFLGFELGKQLLENFAPIRTLGDVLGTTAAALANLTEFGLNKLFAILTRNTKASDEATAAFQRNRAVIAEQWSAAISGASERLRALELAQQALVANLGKTAAAASDAAGGLDTAVSRIAANVNAQLAGIDQFIARLQTRLAQLSLQLQQNITIAATLGQAAIATINAEAQTRLAALDNLRNSELAIAAQVLEIQQKQAADRLAAIKKSTADQVAAFEADAAARIDIAKRTGENLKKVETDIAVARRALLQSIVDANRANVNELTGQLTGYLNTVREIELRRVGFTQSAEEQIRQLRVAGASAGLDAYGQYQLKIREIDRLISEGRRALQGGDAKLAEDYAKRAIAATADISRAVSVGASEVVSQAQASARAISKISEAAKLGNDALKAQGDAAQEGADKTKVALGTAEQELRKVSEQLTDISNKLSEGIELSIKANVDAVKTTIAELDAKIAEQDHVLAIKADVTLAQIEIKRLKDELEQGVTINVAGRTEKIEEAIKRVFEQQPELGVDVNKALASIGEVRKAAADIERIHVQIDSNANEVQKEIDKLKLDTSSTHTIFVKRVEAGGGTGSGTPGGGGEEAPGGQGFARGGPVFPLAPWSKVPGSGSGDTVPAALPVGAFVLRKAASQFYGDSLLGRLVARGLSAGGPVQRFAGGGSTAPELNIFSAEVMRGGDTDIAGLTRKLKIVAEQEFTKILERATGLPHATWGQDVRIYVGRVLELIRQSSNPDEIKTYLSRVLDYYQSFYPAIENARQFNVPLVMGFFDSTPPQGNAKAAQKIVFLENLVPTSENKPGSGRFGAEGQTGGIFHFSRGGQAEPDTVPAWLTPGEWVVRPQAVRHWGSGVMHAINQMRVPRGVLAGALSAPAPQRFYGGGPVGAIAASSGAGNGAAMGGTRTVNINIYAQRVDEAEVRRSIIPVLDKINRSSR